MLPALFLARRIRVKARFYSVVGTSVLIPILDKGFCKTRGESASRRGTPCPAPTASRLDRRHYLEIRLSFAGSSLLLGCHLKETCHSSLTGAASHCHEQNISSRVQAGYLQVYGRESSICIGINRAVTQHISSTKFYGLHCNKGLES